MTTHSPIFIQLYQPESIIHVCRTSDLGTYTVQKTIQDIESNEKQALKLLTEFDTERNELFFAKKVVLVEGNTEKVALPQAFKLYGIDINKEGISIVECGGKAQLATFIKVVKAFNIPYIVLADDDTELLDETKDEKAKTKQAEKIEQNTLLNSRLNDICDAEKLFWMIPDFEGEMKLPKNQRNKVMQALTVFENTTKEQLPQCIKKPIEKILEIQNIENPCEIREPMAQS